MMNRAKPPNLQRPAVVLVVGVARFAAHLTGLPLQAASLDLPAHLAVRQLPLGMLAEPPPVSLLVRSASSGAASVLTAASTVDLYVGVPVFVEAGVSAVSTGPPKPAWTELLKPFQRATQAAPPTPLLPPLHPFASSHGFLLSRSTRRSRTCRGSRAEARRRSSRPSVLPHAVTGCTPPEGSAESRSAPHP